MPNLWTEETYVNETAGVQTGNSGVYETFTDDVSRLFREYRRENGAPSKMFVDSKVLGRSVHVGWVFTKTKRYDDTREKYVVQAWVQLFETCAQDDSRALLWNPGRKPEALGENESLRAFDIEEARKIARRAA